MRIDRRFLLLAPLGAAACASAGGYGGEEVLAKAIAAAGGEAALARVRELAWTGEATVSAGGQELVIEVDTVVRPFGYAKSTSWPKAQGRGAARTMLIENGEGFVLRGDERTPLPAAQLAHERQQFAMYGLMLLVPLRQAMVRETAPGKDGTRNLHVEHPEAAACDLRFAADGRLIRAANNVRDPDGGSALIPQVFAFSDLIESNGVKWPRRISIRQHDAPYFDLRLGTFETRG